MIENQSLTPKVVKVGNLPEKFIFCKNCGSEIQYYPYNVKNTTGFYCGSLQSINYITCPFCKSMIVESTKNIKIEPIN